MKLYVVLMSLALLSFGDGGSGIGSGPGTSPPGSKVFPTKGGAGSGGGPGHPTEVPGSSPRVPINVPIAIPSHGAVGDEPFFGTIFNDNQAVWFLVHKMPGHPIPKTLYMITGYDPYTGVPSGSELNPFIMVIFGLGGYSAGPIAVYVSSAPIQFLNIDPLPVGSKIFVQVEGLPGPDVGGGSTGPVGGANVWPVLI